MFKGLIFQRSGLDEENVEILTDESITDGGNQKETYTREGVDLHFVEGQNASSSKMTHFLRIAQMKISSFKFREFAKCSNYSISAGASRSNSATRSWTLKVRNRNHPRLI